jgi:hypothetical protein
MGNPTAFQDDAAVAARSPEVPLASFANGMNMSGSCAPGVGINIDAGAVVGTPEQFTLLDQRGLARVGQRSQSIGGFPYVANAAYPSSGGQEGYLPDAVISVGTLPTQAAKDADPALDGTLIEIGNATLADLATGWVAA